MIPQHRLSSELVEGEFLFPDFIPSDPLEGFELGGIALQDTSLGLRHQVWRAFYDGSGVFLTAESLEEPILLFTEPGIVDLDLAFDQTMNWNICYTKDVEGQMVSEFRWFDPTIQDYRIEEYPGALNLKVTLDDKRSLAATTSDVILTYVRDDNLYFRAQRERYLQEYLLAEGVQGTLRRFGMGLHNRLMWEFVTVVEPPGNGEEAIDPIEEPQE